ncbi:siderophore-interacting protein [Dermabacteraceae bacterium TAE3-ERU5]|nr:siderophore-interacting protein [Dermabacteraceae bacterium TAE3-ERU5]
MATELKRGFQGAVLKVFRASDTVATVLGSETLGSYVRVRLHSDDLFTLCPYHPTMWLRLWFPLNGKGHQRAYTVIEADPEKGDFSLDFYRHEGTAANWAENAQAGDQLEVTIMGTKDPLPEHSPARLRLIGDHASLPALRELRRAHPQATAQIALFPPAEAELPGLEEFAKDELHLFEHNQLAEKLTDFVTPTDASTFTWVSLDTSHTRQAKKALRGQEHFALGYWLARR